MCDRCMLPWETFFPDVMRIMATTTVRTTETVTLVITSTMATMMMQMIEMATTMVKMMLVQVILHLKSFIVLRRMMVATRLKKLTQVRVVLEVIAAPNPMVANEVVWGIYIYITMGQTSWQFSQMPAPCCWHKYPISTIGHSIPPYQQCSTYFHASLSIAVYIYPIYPIYAHPA